jgi:phosphohistidine phosphatase
MPLDLFLIRHAKSSWKDVRLSDHERPLNKRGRHDSPMMAKLLKKTEIMPDRVISSTAERAKLTAKEFAKEFGIREIVLLEELYMADEEDFLGTLSKLSGEDNCVLLFSHNPGITDFANFICGADIPEIPTCGIVHVHFPLHSWKDVKKGTGIFRSLDYPKNHPDK